MSSKQLIDRLMQNHDDHPLEAAAALRSLNADDVLAEDIPRVAFLVNHVIGEKELKWNEAFILQQRFGRENRTPKVVRDIAVAATLSGNLLEAWTAESILRTDASATFSQASVAIRLGILQYIAPTSNANHISTELQVCLGEIQSWHDAGRLVGLMAGALNNVISYLMDNPGTADSDTTYRQAIAEGSFACRDLWVKAGTWVNHERAEYLIALVHNKLGIWDVACDAAKSGLAIIRANGEEDVDQAFFLLELGKALHRLGFQSDAEVARQEAFSLAKHFNEPGLDEWFAMRAKLTSLTTELA
ncbi:hypothetical protein [Glaciimonas soli]|uniref:Tetratricopeptide repeat protein n=1 Tax=Glaciimonas soli TaxID=2590999 RepID=A0A843YPG8_9BURK|nr:hypothetical protein [Glaciimonas soli]MQR01385.1 hypothetical protein [Glaciimonas soli]